jgi:hypothetical protein
MNIMNLHDYPTAIAQVQRQLLKRTQQLRTLQEGLAFCLSAIDRQVAFDQGLKNDNQRKARRAELMESDSDYIRALLELRQVEDDRAELEIDLQLLQSQLALLKLERRDAIARLELQASVN